MTKATTIWRTESGSGELTNDNADVQRTTESGTVRKTESDVTRVLEDTVVTNKAETTWSESDS